VSQEFNMDHDFVSRGIASLFAGGLGNTGTVCGAVIGATMAMGLKKGRADTMEGVLDNLELAKEFRRRFEQEVGTIYCRDITGVDLTTPEGIEQYMQSGKPDTACVPAVNKAHRLAVELLKEAD
jgi:C_GCAxxG_C_C family probable redox protein